MRNLEVGENAETNEEDCDSQVCRSQTVLPIFVGETGKNVKEFRNKYEAINKNLNIIEIDVNNKETILNNTFLKSNLQATTLIYVVFDCENSDDVGIVKEIIRQKDEINCKIENDIERLIAWGFTYKDNENTKDLDHCVVSKDYNSIFESAYKLILAELTPSGVGTDCGDRVDFFRGKRLIKTQFNRYERIEDFDISKVELDFNKIVPCSLSITSNNLDWIYKIVSAYIDVCGDNELLLTGSLESPPNALETILYYMEELQ